MINEKKIEEAAKDVCFDPTMSYDSQCKIEGFKKGVNWAIQEFLKDLWHSKDEEPQVNRNMLIRFSDGYCLGFKWTEPYYWKEYCNNDSTIDKWLYVDDLLPKEGGEQ